MVNRLIHLHLAGFKSIVNADIQFGDLTVMIGANGAGKSNLISFFSLLNFLCTSALQEFVGRQGGANSLLHFGAKRTPVLEATATFEGDKGQNRYHLKLAHVAGDRLIFLGESVQYCKHGASWTSAPQYALGAGHSESELPNLHADAGKNKLPQKTREVMLGMMGSWRVFQFHDTSSTARFKQAHYADDNRALKSDAGNLAPFLLMLRDTARREYDGVVIAIRRVLPSFEDFVLDVHPVSKNVMLNWKHRTSDDVFGPHQLSDGSLRFMALCALLLQPRPPSLILLDEPELGLHPFAIELLAGMLQSVSVHSQVVVSTQSAALVNRFSPDQILVVDAVDDSSKFQRLDKDALSEWLAEFGPGDLWVKNLVGGTPS